MVERTETCEGCGHPIRSHFRNVVGEVVCMHSWADAWGSGNIGCDCVDYRSEMYIRRKQREQEKLNAIRKVMDEYPHLKPLTEELRKAALK